MKSLYISCNLLIASEASIWIRELSSLDWWEWQYGNITFVDFSEVNVNETRDLLDNDKNDNTTG